MDRVAELGFKVAVATKMTAAHRGRATLRNRFGVAMSGPGLASIDPRRAVRSRPFNPCPTLGGANSRLRAECSCPQAPCGIGTIGEAAQEDFPG